MSLAQNTASDNNTVAIDPPYLSFGAAQAPYQPFHPQQPSQPYSHQQQLQQHHHLHHAAQQPQQQPPSCNVLVAGLTSEIDEAGLRSIFADCGPIVSATVMLEVNTGRSRGFGFVCFASHEDAMKAVRSKHRSSLPGGNVLNLTLSHHSGSAQQSPSLFIRNVPAQVSSRVLSVLMSSFGNVASTHVSHTNDPTMCSAVVRFSSVGEAAAALSALHGAREFLLPRQQLTDDDVESLKHLIAEWDQPNGSPSPAAVAGGEGASSYTASPHRSRSATPIGGAAATAKAAHGETDAPLPIDRTTSPPPLSTHQQRSAGSNLLRVRLTGAPLLVKYHENAAVRRGRPRGGDTPGSAAPPTSSHTTHAQQYTKPTVPSGVPAHHTHQAFSLSPQQHSHPLATVSPPPFSTAPTSWPGQPTLIYASHPTSNVTFAPPQQQHSQFLPPGTIALQAPTAGNHQQGAVALQPVYYAAATPSPPTAASQHHNPPQQQAFFLSAPGATPIPLFGSVPPPAMTYHYAGAPVGTPPGGTAVFLDSRGMPMMSAHPSSSVPANSWTTGHAASDLQPLAPSTATGQPPPPHYPGAPAPPPVAFRTL